MRYSIEPGDRIFVKGYRVLSFAKNIGKNIGRNFDHHAKQYVTDALEATSKRSNS